ncbi:hypothetical protein D3C71_1170690 [compost metagenome]
MRRVERVADDKALRMPATGLQAAHDEARRTGRDDDMGRQHCIHAGKEVDLEVFAFGRVFLHEVHAGQRPGQVRFKSQGIWRGAFSDVPQFSQHGPRGLDAGPCLRFGIASGVADHHIHPASQKQRRPTGSDGAGANDGDTADGRLGLGGAGHAALLVIGFGHIVKQTPAPCLPPITHCARGADAARPTSPRPRSWPRSRHRPRAGWRSSQAAHAGWCPSRPRPPTRRTDG